MLSVACGIGHSQTGTILAMFAKRVKDNVQMLNKNIAHPTLQIVPDSKQIHVSKRLEKSTFSDLFNFLVVRMVE